MATTDLLSRHAGPIALAVGVLLAALDLGRLPIAAAALQDPLLVTVNPAYFFGFPDRPARSAVRAGGRTRHRRVLRGRRRDHDDGGDRWFDSFASPWLAEVAPQVFTTPHPTPIYELATLRARVFPRSPRSASSSRA